MLPGTMHLGQLRLDRQCPHPVAREFEQRYWPPRAPRAVSQFPRSLTVARPSCEQGYTRRSQWPIMAVSTTARIRRFILNSCRRGDALSASLVAMRMSHTSPAARAISNTPAPMTEVPIARVTRSPPGASRSRWWPRRSARFLAWSTMPNIARSPRRLMAPFIIEALAIAGMLETWRAHRVVRHWRVGVAWLHSLRASVVSVRNWIG